MDKKDFWLKEYSALAVFGGVVGEYDLKQCIELDKRLNYLSARSARYMLFCSILPMCIFAVWLGAINILDSMGIMTFVKDPALIFVIMLIWVPLLFYAGFNYAIETVLKSIKRRIRTIAGVSNGEETQGKN